jgi:hypothetical protein
MKEENVHVCMAMNWVSIGSVYVQLSANNRSALMFSLAGFGEVHSVQFRTLVGREWLLYIVTVNCSKNEQFRVDAFHACRVCSCPSSTYSTLVGSSLCLSLCLSLSLPLKVSSHTSPSLFWPIAKYVKWGAHLSSQCVSKRGSIIDRCTK